MREIINKIIENNAVEDAKGNTYPLHSHTSIDQCHFIQKMMEKCDASSCIEIGLAYGISSMFICESLAKKNNPRFISIDPLQSDWNEIGLYHLNQCGYDKFTEFHRDYSDVVLPKLYASNVKIDFAYVDTSKVFDVVLLDAVYLTKMLKTGGIIVFDDCQFPGLKTLARYLVKWPHLKVADKFNTYESNSSKRRMISKVINHLPKKNIFSNHVRFTDEYYGVNANCIAFEKTDEDTRSWNWYEPVA